MSHDDHLRETEASQVTKGGRVFSENEAKHLAQESTLAFSNDLVLEIFLRWVVPVSPIVKS